MTRPYSEDIRERALARADAGETVRSIAEALQISPSCVTKWKNLRRETGGLSPGKIGGHKKRVLSDANADWLRKRLRSGPFTLRKLTQELAARGIKTDVRAVWTFVHTEGLSFKKNDPAHRTRASRRRPETDPLEGASRPDRRFTPGVYRRDLDQNQHGAVARLGALWAAPPRICSFRPLEDHDLHRSTAPRPDQRTLGH
jgi:transposase